jgi:hypothetical protein
LEASDMDDVVGILMDHDLVGGLVGLPARSG